MEIPDARESDLLIGDVLLFRGATHYAEAIRLVDGGRFDHAALVVGISGGEIEIVEVNFARAERKALRDYGEPVEEVCVRRHRIEGAGAVASKRAIELSEQSIGYAYDRLLTIALSLISSFTGRLSHLEQQDSVNFHANLMMLLGLVAENPSKLTDRTCTELVADAFDVPLDLSDSSPVPYFGLSIPRTAAAGLLSWVASGQSFVDYTISGPIRAIDDHQGDTSTARVMQLSRALYIEEGLSFPGGVDRSENELKAVVLKTTETLFAHLNIPLPTGNRYARLQGTGLLSQAASMLLDQLLRYRIILTPTDLAATRSLYTVGILQKIEGHRRGPATHG